MLESIKKFSDRFKNPLTWYNTSPIKYYAAEALKSGFKASSGYGISIFIAWATLNHCKIDTVERSKDISYMTLYAIEAGIAALLFIFTFLARQHRIKHSLYPLQQRINNTNPETCPLLTKQAPLSKTGKLALFFEKSISRIQAGMLALVAYIGLAIIAGFASMEDGNEWNGCFSNSIGRDAGIFITPLLAMIFFDSFDDISMKTLELEKKAEGIQTGISLRYS